MVGALKRGRRFPGSDAGGGLVPSPDFLFCLQMLCGKADFALAGRRFLPIVGWTKLFETRDIWDMRVEHCMTML